ncbi:MAG: 4Fe-4S dicluster domain-containing protein [Kiritimatiellae bacterium]|nr:4Fe-4S dicluster domain-containing protein [Kiritimatiellia bacterium]
MSKEMTRKGFLISGVAAAAMANSAAAEECPFVSLPGVPRRKNPVFPAGIGSIDEYRAKCVGCQLCVKACPEKVLRPYRGMKYFLLPVAGFEHGYCRPSCSRCAEACPSGAIRKISVEVRFALGIGSAVLHKERCIASAKGIVCTACERHCPVSAITLENGIPVVDRQLCIGCGACENLCPSRPLPAITVEGKGE